MKKLLKRALAVLQSYDADEFVNGAEVMRDILTELAKPEPAKTSKNEILHHSLDFVRFCWRELNLNDYAEELRSKLEDDLVAELAKPEPEPAYWLAGGKLATSKQFCDFHYPNLQAIPLYFGERHEKTTSAGA